MRRKGQVTSTVTEAERIVSGQVPENRKDEILQYLRLFGYKPERTILQVHIPGFFNKKRRKDTARSQAALKRYGGTTFVIVGRTHDPSIMDQLIPPKKKRDDANPGYVGYLWKNKDSAKRSPHEILPLDFTPMQVKYPPDWKNMFATEGFMIAMHVPASFAKNKNQLSRALYQAGKTVDVKMQWEFLKQVAELGFENISADPIGLLKVA